MIKVWNFNLAFVLWLCSVSRISHALPISDDGLIDATTQIDTNGTAKDLYVIKTIVYEVGILTDVGNDTDNDTGSHDEIDLTFFNPNQSGSIFNLSNIPIPLQTNVSGLTVTGIAATDFGTLALPTDDNDVEEATLTPSFPLQIPLFPNALVNVRRNVSFVQELNRVKFLEKIPSLLDFEEPITGIPLKIETESTESNVKSVIDTFSKESKENSEEKNEDP